MKLLLTAFEPFGGETVNAAWEAVNLLPDRLGALEIIKRTVPTEFDRSIACVTAAVEAVCPDAVLCVGQAGGRAALTPERIAVNLRDARIPDNAGFQPQDEPVAPGGPAAYFSTLPVKAMAQAIRAAGLPGEVSNTAGLYVCNNLMYGLLHFLAGTRRNIPGGFLHVPLTDAQAAAREKPTPGLPLEDIAGGLTAAISAIFS